MSSPRPESEEITLDTLKQRMMAVRLASRNVPAGIVELYVLSQQFSHFLKNDPRVTPELLAQFFIESSGLDRVPMMLSLFFNPVVTLCINQYDIDELVNKASPDILIKVNRDNLTTFINDYIEALSESVKNKNGRFSSSSEKFINPFLSILRILSSKNHDAGPAFRKVFEILITRAKVQPRWLQIDSENFRAMLIKLEAEDFQCLREAAYSNDLFHNHHDRPRHQSIFDTLIGDEIEHKDLFQIFLQTLGFDGLAELLGNIWDFHAKRFPFYKKINSIFEITPGQYITPDFERNQYFDEYFKFLASPVNYFRKYPDKCRSLIVALNAFPIESVCFKKNKKLVSALEQIQRHLELNPDQDRPRLRIIMYSIAKCYYATFMAKQEKSEEFSVMIASKLATPKSLSKETKESALIAFKEKEEKIAKKLQAELAPVVVDQLDYHNRAVEIWLNILPVPCAFPSESVLIGDALRGCIKNSAFQHIKDPVAIQIRALQYYWLAAFDNDRDAIQAIEFMAADMGVLMLPEFKDKQKTEKKEGGEFKFFRFDRKAEEEKKQSAEPAPLDEDKNEEASSWKILYAKIINQLKFQRIENLINVISQRIPSSDISRQLQAMLANLKEAKKSNAPVIYIREIAKALPNLAARIAKIKIEEDQRSQLTKELDWLKESLITPASSDVSHEMKRSGPAR